MFIFCVKEADWGMMAWVAYVAPWFSEEHTMSFRMYHVTVYRISNTLVQATLGVGSVNFRSFTDKGGGGGAVRRRSARDTARPRRGPVSHPGSRTPATRNQGSGPLPHRRILRRTARTGRHTGAAVPRDVHNACEFPPHAFMRSQRRATDLPLGRTFFFVLLQRGPDGPLWVSARSRSVSRPGAVGQARQAFMCNTRLAHTPGH